MNHETNYKVLNKIKYSILEIIALILLIIFALNPIIKLLFQINIRWNHFMLDYNGRVLIIGILIIGIYVVKLKVDGKLGSFKELLKEHIPVVLFAVFGMLMIITTLLNGAPQIAIEGYAYRGEGLIGYLSYIVYFVLAAFLLSEKKKKVFVGTFLVTSMIVGLVIFIDYIFLDRKYNYAMGDYMIFSQFNHLAYYLIVSIMFFGMMFITAKKIFCKIMYLCGFSFMIVVLIMNDTWGCQIALLVGMIFTIVVYSVGKGRIQPVAIVLLIAMLTTYVAAWNMDDRLRRNIKSNIIQHRYDTNAFLDEDNIIYITTGVARMLLWETTWGYVCESPIIGHGADVTGERLKEDVGNDRCHCEFLNYAVSFGVPTAVVYMAAIFMVYLRGLKKKQQLSAMNYAGLCVAFTYLTSSLIGNSMFYTAPYLFIALGMGYENDIAIMRK